MKTVTAGSRGIISVGVGATPGTSAVYVEKMTMLNNPIELPEKK